ncbi:Ubiquitin carboxyl-terminal hydrolase 40 [Galemys pyrenaicus]|uniref:Ubiquitin carboxyl-terminal hydrolase 40 n=1 Tax=Galemys pyrenaicus TaxID=202257 RepID=A0A8J6DQ31_GALPY|nr:Ubiquitin carboxyl-terminal hydrolase 40 [Galemys pyrenaicus]
MQVQGSAVFVDTKLPPSRSPSAPDYCLTSVSGCSPQDVLLRTQMRIPGERAYSLAVDLVWDTARGWTAGSLRQRVADFYSLPVEKTEIAKHFPEKFEWLPVSSWVKSWASLGKLGLTG